jgi:hypothetical protein
VVKLPSWKLSDVRPVKHQAVTDEDLDLARRDPAFRQRLIATNLDHLLVALARIQASETAREPEPARQIQEGVELAMKLAQLLHTAAERVQRP